MFPALLKVSLRRQLIENIRSFVSQKQFLFSLELSFTLKLRSPLVRLFLHACRRVQGQYRFDIISYTRIWIVDWQLKSWKMFQQFLSICILACIAYLFHIIYRKTLRIYWVYSVLLVLWITLLFYVIWKILDYRSCAAVYLAHECECYRIKLYWRVINR